MDWFASDFIFGGVGIEWELYHEIKAHDL